MSPQQEPASIVTREVSLDASVANLRFTKAIVEMEPLGRMAVVHYAIDGIPHEDGIAVDLDKCIFLDDCEVRVAGAAVKVRNQILAGLHPR